MLCNVAHLVASVAFLSIPPIRVAMLLLALWITALTLTAAITCLPSLQSMLWIPLLAFRPELWERDCHRRIVFLHCNRDSWAFIFVTPPPGCRPGCRSCRTSTRWKTSNYHPEVYPSSGSRCARSLALNHPQFNCLSRHRCWSRSRTPGSSMHIPAHFRSRLISKLTSHLPNSTHSTSPSTCSPPWTDPRGPSCLSERHTATAKTSPSWGEESTTRFHAASSIL